MSYIDSCDRQPDAIMQARCPKCGATFPISVYMDDCGQIVDHPLGLDYADFWLHHWSHEVVV